MNGFTIFYGVIYLFLWFWIYQEFENDFSWWVVSLIAFFVVIMLHLSLTLFGYISMRRHKAKKAHLNEIDEKE